MVKKLHDICLQCIGENLHSISRVGKFLPTKHKEILLRRLVDHDMLTQQYLPHITYHLFSPAIRRVTFKWCDQVTDHVLTQIDLCQCKLDSIVITGCQGVTDGGVHTVLHQQNGLERLKLRNLPHLTCKGLEAVASPNLEEVDLFKCANIENRGVQSLVTKNPTISKLNLGYCYKVTEDIIPNIAQCLGSNLLHLDLGCLQTLSNTNLEMLAENCPNIKILILQGCNRITGECLPTLFSKCNRMQLLDLSFCHKILEPQNNLKHLPLSITTLVLGGLQVDGEQLQEAIARLPKLEDLQLCGINTLDDDSIKKIFKSVGKQLTNVDMSGCRQSLDDHTLRHIVNYCTELEHICLTYCANLKGTSLLEMFQDKKRAQQVVEIRLSGCREIEYSVLEAISTSCSNIESLFLSGVHSVTDQILISVANNCPKLKRVGVKSCTSQVTDVGVVEIARCCPALKEIVLSGLHAITDKSVLAIANNCPDLGYIYVSGCNKVTHASINYLKDVCNSRVYVQHKLPNVDPNQVMAKNLDTGEFCRVDQTRYDRYSTQ
ncbi:uncharacterized protein [Amphiura filiformis]|uniref:uncharacterized protein n=1 Tax=Amphiura filiformis TaxID=82378 RepID=UPI003B21A0C3